jgi:hypothetical protein
VPFYRRLSIKDDIKAGRAEKIRPGLARSCLVWFGLVWFGLVWFGLVWFGLVWFGLVWFGLVWFGLVWFGRILAFLTAESLLLFFEELSI